MKEIDLTSWKRKTHFEFFRRSDLPFYNVNTNVDISGLKEFAKKNSLSLNSVLMFVTICALNAIENFRYRLHGESVVLHDTLHPSFAHIRDGDDLFSLITLDFVDDLPAFDKAVREAIANTTEYFNIEKLKTRDDFVFISSLPWFSFTGIDHTLSLKRDDGIPRISWGKLFESGGKRLLPFNIQVNHMFVDGIHVGRFLDQLAREITALATGACCLKSVRPEPVEG